MDESCAMLDLEQVRRSLQERERVLAESEEANRQCRAELEQDKAAFARVAQLVQNTSMELPLALPEAWVQGAKLGLAKAVVEAVKACAPNANSFSSVDVAKVLSKPPLAQRLAFDFEKNRANISAQMRRLAEKQLIVQLKPGSGRRPATYRVTPQFSSLG